MGTDPLQQDLGGQQEQPNAPKPFTPFKIPQGAKVLPLSQLPQASQAAPASAPAQPQPGFTPFKIPDGAQVTPLSQDQDQDQDQSPSSQPNTVERFFNWQQGNLDRLENGERGENAITSAVGSGLGNMLLGAEKQTVKGLWDIGGLTLKGWNAVTPKSLNVAVDDSTPDYLQAHGISQNVGAAGEQVAEFLLGDWAAKAAVEGVKGLTVAQKLSKAAKEMEIIQDNPKLMTALRLGMGAMRVGSVQAAQAKLHGADTVDALESGAFTGATAGAFDALSRGAAAAKTAASSRMWGTAKFIAGAGWGVDQTYNAFLAEKEGETPEESEQRRGMAAVNAFLGFAAIHNAIDEGHANAVKASMREGKLPGQEDMMRARYPNSAHDDAEKHLLNILGDSVPYVAREAQNPEWGRSDTEAQVRRLGADAKLRDKIGEGWKSSLSILGDKKGEIAKAADVTDRAASKLWEAQVKPTENSLKQFDNDVSPVATEILKSKNNMISKEHAAAIDEFAEKFAGQRMTIPEMSKTLHNLNTDPGVASYYDLDSKAEQALMLAGNPIVREKINAAKALRTILFDTVTDRGGEAAGKAYAKARTDWGSLSELGATLRHTKSGTPAGIGLKIANMIRFFVFPHTVIHQEMLGGLKSNERFVARAFEDMGKFGTPAPDAKLPDVQQPLMTNQVVAQPGPDRSMFPEDTTSVFGLNVEGHRGAADPETVRQLVAQATASGHPVQLTPEQLRVYHENFGKQPYSDVIEKGQLGLNPEVAAQRSDMGIFPQADNKLFGVEPTDVTPMEYSNERLRQLTEALSGWNDIRSHADEIIHSETATTLEKDAAKKDLERAEAQLARGELPPDKAAPTAEKKVKKLPPTAAEANASHQVTIDHLEGQLTAARQAAAAAKPGEQTEKLKEMDAIVKQLLAAHKLRDGLTGRGRET